MKLHILSFFGAAALAVSCTTAIADEFDPTYQLKFTSFGHDGYMASENGPWSPNHSTLENVDYSGIDVSASLSGNGWVNTGVKGDDWGIYSVANTAANPAVGLFTFSDTIQATTPLTFSGVSYNPWWATSEISLTFYNAGKEVQYTWQDTGLTSRQDESGKVWITSDSDTKKSVSVVPTGSFDAFEIRIHNTNGNSTIYLSPLNFKSAPTVPGDMPNTPEPSTYAAIISAVIFGGIMLRRRRK